MSDVECLAIMASGLAALVFPPSVQLGWLVMVCTYTYLGWDGWTTDQRG